MTSNNSLPSTFLRPWNDSAQDLEAVLAAFNADDMAGQSGELINSEAAARRWLAYWVEKMDAHAVGFAIECDGQAVGHVMANSIEYRHETAWVSYWVTPAARGRGLAAAATAALADYCFENLGLYRLELAHRVNNPASGHVAQRAGFIVEGTERGKLMYLDEFDQRVRFDVRTYSRLATDPAPSIARLQVQN